MDNSGYDVIVIGGGPGGSSAATFIAKAGHKVLLLEKAKFPRYQIGESLLPATVQGVCGLLGVKDEIESAGFIPKRGGTFIWGKNPEPWSFHFEQKTIDGKLPRASAMQVERSTFDNILLKNAIRNGVEVKEQCFVLDVRKHGDRIVGVCCKTSDGLEFEGSSRYVIDASGHASKFYRHVGERIHSELFKNIAIYGYFKGCKRLPHPNEGDTLSIAFDLGWFWVIPLQNGLTSVGAVVGKEELKNVDNLEAALSGYIKSCPQMKEMLATATRIDDETYGKIRIRRDYSYNNTKFWKNGLVLVGDAACFIDPLFSSGVHLSTYSGLLAARSINTILKDHMSEEKAFDEFETRFRKEYGNFYNFLMAFYDIEQEKEDYFWSARKILNTSESANEAFARLITGFSTEGIGTANSTKDYFSKREGFGEAIKNHFSRDPNESNVSHYSSARINTDLFMKGFQREIIDLQLQAKLQELNIEMPMVGGQTPDVGLTVSNDFLHWKEVCPHNAIKG